MSLTIGSSSVTFADSTCGAAIGAPITMESGQLMVAGDRTTIIHAQGPWPAHAISANNGTVVVDPQVQLIPTTGRTAIGGNATAHDARGNLTIDPTRGQTYAYTSENELKSASGGISAYYDPLGRLTEYDTNVSRRFMSDGPQIAVEIDNPNSNVVRRFVWGDALDELIVEYTGSGTSNRRWAHADERGSIIAYTDGSGTATINRYDEFGRPLAGNIGVFQYTGQMWLSELGLYNYKARNYAPHFGRFMQTDLMGYEAGPNLYAYVGNDPVNFTDPLGLDVLVIGDNTLLHLQDAFAESLLESRPRGLPFDPRSREPGTREPKEPEEVVVVCDRACQNRIQNKYRPTGRTPFYFNGTRYALDPFYEKPWWSEEFDVAVGCLAVCPIGVAVLGTEAVVVDAASVGYRLYGRGTKWQVMTRGGGVKIRSDVMKPNTHWNIEIGPWNWHIPH